jgi:ribonuclease HI
MKATKYLFYTDGSTRANGQANAVGGWAFIQLAADYGTLVTAKSGSEMGSTNQRMELTAAINALDSIADELCPFDEVEVVTDSAYLHNCYKQKWYLSWQTNGWKNSKKQPVANQDLWERLIPYFENPNITFTKTKGHADNVWNNYVDDLAQTASARAKENKV